MSKFGMIFAFLAGAAAGGATAWYVANARYAAISEQDISSTKEAFHVREQKLKKEIEELKTRLESQEEAETPQTTVLASNKNHEKGDISDYARTVREIERTKYSQTVVPKTPDHEVEAPYIIDPEEFGELDGYTTISLFYFEDGILSDENGVIIDEPEEIVGDALSQFDEDEDAVYVRSDPKRCDYEVLKDLRSYADFRATLPPKI